MKEKNTKKKVHPERSRMVFVGMSGGVDSSVSAGILKSQGYEVVGVHLRCYNLDGCADQDAEDARRAAEVLGIPFYVLDFEEEYKARVVEYMIEGYRKGITPNPDVMCNKEIKFGLFFKKAMEMGADYVATGHYVRLVTSNKRHGTSKRNQNSMSPVTGHRSLFIAKDKNKDQSYFLWTLTAKQLEHCIFPLGNIKKPAVRKLAKKFGLLNAEKKDSQGICFLGKITIADFLKQYIPEKKGVIVDTAGRELGTHEGAHFYTIGQRHGLKLDKKNNALKNHSGTTPIHYVASKDVVSNTIIVAEGENNEELYRKEIKLTQENMFLDEKSKFPLEVFARVRYRQTLAKAKLYIEKGKNPSLVFATPQKFVASGQSAVFYSKTGEMLGGGVIL